VIHVHFILHQMYVILNTQFKPLTMSLCKMYMLLSLWNNKDINSMPTICIMAK